MTGIVSHRGSKVISIYAMPDHLHILISLNPDEALSELVKEIKRSFTLYINDNNQLPRRFQWQAGYAAFSYSRSMIKIVSKYIENQEKHHKVKTFREEYIEFLEKFGVEYDLKYIFTES
ncbi:MAG: transposase [Chloroflexota bacterium]